MINFKNIALIVAILSISSCSLKQNSQPQETKNPIISSTNTPETNIAINNQFVKGTHDVPLALNLKLVNNEDIDFDSVDGSFTSSTYQSEDAITQIKDFYLENLPRLGWKIEESQTNTLVFIRENQKLKIELSNDLVNSTAIFTLTIN